MGDRLVGSEWDEWWWLELLDFGFPPLTDGEYLHSIPQVRHLEQTGLALEHLTFAKKHPSQDARSRGCRGLLLEDMVGYWEE
jgi:hypothetical protein